MSVPEAFGRYELRGLLGRGGMGEVFRAYDTVRHREVALKLLPEHLAQDEDFQERFRRESQIAARLSAPHVIPIHDFGAVDGRLFIDMRLVEGEDLAAVLRRVGRLSPDLAVELIGQIASALDAAHAGGLVHRDVKPSNVLVTDLGTGNRPFAYLVDFGLARPVAQDESELTRTGAVGTLPYLAPERITGSPGDHRADVYALGCVLFELLTGRKPWDGDMYTVLSGHLKAAPPRPSVEVAGVAPALDAVIATALAKRPDDRFARAGDLARAARQALDNPGFTLAAPGGTSSGPPPGAPPTIVPGAPVAPRVPPTAAPTDPRTSAPPTYAGRPAAPPSYPGPSHAGPSHAGPSYPGPSHGGPPADPSRRGRLRLVAVSAVVLLVLVAVVGFVVFRDDGSPAAQRSSTSAVTPTPTPTALRSGTGSTPSWTDFASFSQLAGTRDNDTTNSFKGAKCTLSGRQTGDPTGLVSEVVCGKAIDRTTVFIGRFGTTDQARTYLQDLQFQQGAAVTAWGVNGLARGLAYASSGTGVTSIDTTVCGLPTYVVRFNAQDPGITGTALHDQYWNQATFPDVVPPACGKDLSSGTGAAGGAMSPVKPTVPLSADQIDLLLERGSGQDAYSTQSPSGIETLLFDQRGALSFWTTTSDGLRRTGTGRYPTADPAGDYRVYFATLFDGMKHGSFVLRGPFSTKGTDENIVLTRSTGAWGPLVLRGRTQLSVAAFPVPAAGRFRELRTPGLTTLQTNVGSDLVTWRWTGTRFVAR